MNLNEQELLNIFRKTEALLEGHFLLTSGRHSSQYFQCAKVLQYTNYNTQICEKIVAHFNYTEIDTVIAPALGGIIVGQEVARQLNKKFIFAEREQTALTLRRGFLLVENEKVLICEDVVTTGGSVFETIEIVKSFGAKINGVGFIVDRSNGKVSFGYPQFSALRVNAVSFPPVECELCKKGIPLVKPGSRLIAK
jgi:orotate phosphoribosyltransferase